MAKVHSTRAVAKLHSTRAVAKLHSTRPVAKLHSIRPLGITRVVATSIPAAVGAIVPVADIVVVAVRIAAVVDIVAAEDEAADVVPTSALSKISSRWSGSTTVSNSIASATRAAIEPLMWASWRRTCSKLNPAQSGAIKTDISSSTMTASA